MEFSSRLGCRNWTFDGSEDESSVETGSNGTFDEKAKISIAGLESLINTYRYKKKRHVDLQL